MTSHAVTMCLISYNCSMFEDCTMSEQIASLKCSGLCTWSENVCDIESVCVCSDTTEHDFLLCNNES